MTTKPLRLIVCGASGRMGARLAALAAEDPRFALACCVVGERRTGLPPAAAVAAAADLPGLLGEADAVVDFSVPEASVRFAAAAARARKPIVIGTTGFSPVQRAQVEALASKTAIFLSPNFSPGVHLMMRLAAAASRSLKGYDASIAEIHHIHKRDSPSGTALRLARAVIEGRGGGEPVPTASQRAGDVVGEHTLTFAGPHERLELTHRAHDRAVFARGALEAALWLRRRKPGLYGMDSLMEIK